MGHSAGGRASSLTDVYIHIHLYPPIRLCFFTHALSNVIGRKKVQRIFVKSARVLVQYGRRVSEANLFLLAPRSFGRWGGREREEAGYHEVCVRDRRSLSGFACSTNLSLGTDASLVWLPYLADYLIGFFREKRSKDGPFSTLTLTKPWGVKLEFASLTACSLRVCVHIRYLCLGVSEYKHYFQYDEI